MQEKLNHGEDLKNKMIEEMKPKIQEQLKSELLTESVISPERLSGLDLGWSDHNCEIDNMLDEEDYDEHFNHDTEQDDA